MSPVKGLLNADVNGARNILRKFKKEWFDLLTGLKRAVKIRLYRLKGISKSQLYADIGVPGRVNLPRGIRTVLSCQTPRGAPSVRVEYFTKLSELNDVIEEGERYPSSDILEREVSPIRPREILRDEFLKPLGISSLKLAKGLGIDQKIDARYSISQ